MPRLKKRESSPPPEANLTLTAGRSRRTIKPNRKYLNDSVVLATASKSSSRSSSPGSDRSEDDYNQEEDDEEVVVSPKSSSAAVGRKSLPATAMGSAKKPLTASGAISTGRPRGRPPKPVTKTEPVKNLRKEVLKKMDLTTLSVGKARVVLTPLKTDPKRKLDLDESITRDKTPSKDEAPKAKFIVRSKEDKPKPEVRIVRKGLVEVRTAEKEDSLKKVINPVALKKQQVEKSILDKRAKQAEGSTEGDDDDDDDDVQIVGISREANPNLGRKVARKSPLVAKQISPLPARKVPGKATPPVGASTSGGLVKRKVGGEETDAESAKKQLRPAAKATKVSISLDSDEEDEEPVRRQTRSSLPTEKASATSTPPTVAAKAKESPASAGAVRTGKTVDSSKGNLTRAISMPTLDKSKAKPAQQTLPTRPVGLSKPAAASTPKPATQVAATLSTKSKSVQNLAQKAGPKASDLKSATIRIVDIGDIIKKSKSTADVRKDDDDDEEQDEEDSEYSDASEDEDRGAASGKPKTNNELVATILERKRPINLDHLRGRAPKRAKPSPRTAGRQTVINLTDEDDIDIEEMLATNIVTANKVQKVMNQSGPSPRGRGRPPASDENTNKSYSNNKNRSVPSAKTPASSGGGVKTLASSNNNNNVYKANNNGRFGSTSTLNRSSSGSPHKNPPRILNSTMKLGDNRPFAKLVSNSGNKHYSIDLTDPDNNVKLVSSPDSPPQSPVKRSPVKAITRPTIVTAGGLRNASNALNKPIGGAVQRSVSALTSAAGASPKMKKITCYETWYVINIPNNENKPEKPSFAMSMIGLGNEAARITMPSADWSHKIILTKRKTTPAEGDEVFTGDVEDRAISEAEKRNYEPCNIMFRRRTATPGKFNLQYDRAVIFKNETFFINVDGKNCQLVGAPSKIDGTADIETLLAVVDFVNLKNTCVELSAA